jgi:uncharacterized phiE125 gp8 family phage protein
MEKTFRYRTAKPSALDIITLDMARSYLNMDIPGVTFADDLIVQFIKSAVAYVERKTNVSFGISTYKWSGGWCSRMRIPDSFYVKSIVSVKATDRDGVETVASPTDYKLVRVGEKESEIRWVYGYEKIPYAEYEIEWTAGFDPSDSPYEELKQAILLLVGSWYDTRVDSVAEKKTLADRIINLHVIGYA